MFERRSPPVLAAVFTPFLGKEMHEAMFACTFNYLFNLFLEKNGTLTMGRTGILPTIRDNMITIEKAFDCPT